MGYDVVFGFIFEFGIDVDIVFRFGVVFAFDFGGHVARVVVL